MNIQDLLTRWETQIQQIGTDITQTDALLDTLSQVDYEALFPTNNKNDDHLLNKWKQLVLATGKLAINSGDLSNQMVIAISIHDLLDTYKYKKEMEFNLVETNEELSEFILNHFADTKKTEVTGEGYNKLMKNWIMMDLHDSILSYRVNIFSLKRFEIMNNYIKAKPEIGIKDPRFKMISVVFNNVFGESYHLKINDLADALKIKHEEGRQILEKERLRIEEEERLRIEEEERLRIEEEERLRIEVEERLRIEEEEERLKIEADVRLRIKKEITEIQKASIEPEELERIINEKIEIINASLEKIRNASLDDLIKYPIDFKDWERNIKLKTPTIALNNIKSINAEVNFFISIFNFLINEISESKKTIENSKLKLLNSIPEGKRQIKPYWF